MPHIQIHQAQAHPPIQGQGQAGVYTVYEWTCSGTVDGVPTNPIPLKTLSGKMAALVAPGWQGMCDIDNHGGVIKYKIPTPHKAAPAPLPGPAPAPSYYPPQPAAPAYCPPPQTPVVTPVAPPPVFASPAQFTPVSMGYTLAELKALYADCFSFAQQLSNGKQPESLSAIAATIFIAAKDNNIKASAVNSPEATRAAATFSGTASSAPQTNDDLEAQVWNELQKAGLVDRVARTGWAVALLKSFWAEAGRSPSMFAMRVNAEMQKIGI